MSVGDYYCRNAVLWTVGLWILLSGCQTRPTLAPQLCYVDFGRSRAGDILRVADTIEISFGVDAPDLRLRIAEDGVILLPMGLTVIGTNKTAIALQEEIRGLYVPRYHDQLDVKVRLKDFFYMQR